MGREHTVKVKFSEGELTRLAHFAKSRLDAISAEDVDRYKAAKLRDGSLGASSTEPSNGQKWAESSPSSKPLRQAAR
jgi:hypothetical protein